MKNKSVLIGLIILIVCIALGIGGYFVFSIRPVFEETTYELGSVDISSNIEDYLFARKSVLNSAVLKTSNVKTNEVGDYTVTCNVKEKEFTYTIHIVDTTKPTIVINSDAIFSTYNEYNLEEFASANDLSDIIKFDIISCTSKNDSSKINVVDNCFTIENDGVYTLSIIAEDEYGNSANIETDINILESPHFILLNDRKYPFLNKIDLLDFVYAQDADGNDISDKVTVVDDGGYNPRRPGSYTVEYRVVDNKDIQRTQTITIKVGERYRTGESGELIVVDEFKDVDFGYTREEVLRTIIDHDYFSYKPLVNNEDMDAVVKLTSPASFSIKAKKRGDEANGSAFLYEVTDDYLYFITNKHCTFLFTDYNEIQLIDYDKDDVTIKNSEIKVYNSPDRDIACFVIPTDCINMDTLIRYRKVSVDASQFDKLQINQSLLINTQEHGYWGYNNVDRINKVTLRGINETEAYNLKFKYGFLTTNEAVVRGGQSGSPLFTFDGQLIGIATSTADLVSRNMRIDMYTQLPDLLEFMNSVDIK